MYQTASCDIHIRTYLKHFCLYLGNHLTTFPFKGIYYRATSETVRDEAKILGNILALIPWGRGNDNTTNLTAIVCTQGSKGHSYASLSRNSIVNKKVSESPCHSIAATLAGKKMLVKISGEGAKA